jgi:hypothetical protein
MLRPALLSAGLALSWVSAAAQSPDPSADLEARLAQAEKDLAAIKERLDKRFRLMPWATLWLTSDYVIYRTAVPELYQKSLRWVFIHNGEDTFGSPIGNAAKVDLFQKIPKKPGGYVVYLETFVDGAYRPVSNVLNFVVDDPTGGAKQNPQDKEPSGEPSPLPQQTTSPSAKSPDQRLQRIEDHLAEYRAFISQQPELRRKYTLWMDSRRIVFRSAGPEELEDDVTWNIRGAGQLSRNARGETAYQHYYQGPGEYTISISSHGQKDLSNILTFTLPRPAGYPERRDVNNDGL